MEDLSPIVQVGPNDIRFWLNVKPRSAKEGLGVDSAGEFRLKVHAPAIGGAANEACINFLARVLRIPRSSIEILKGDKSRKKLIRIRGGEDVACKLWSAAGLVLRQNSEK